MDFALYDVEVKGLSRDSESVCACIIVSGVISKRNRFCTTYSVGDQVVLFAAESSVELQEEEDSLTVQVSESFIIPKTNDVNHEAFVIQLRNIFRTLNALHYSLSVLSGESIFILHPPDVTPMQISALLGLTVFYYSKEDLKSKTVKLASFPEHLLSETGGLGVNHVLDFSTSHSSSVKKAVLDCLSIRGKWALKNTEFQLDPPETSILFLKNASISFFNENSWPYNGIEQAKFLHLLNNAMKYVK
jgi:hypothetical protein